MFSSSKAAALAIAVSIIMLGGIMLAPAGAMGSLSRATPIALTAPTPLHPPVSPGASGPTSGPIHPSSTLTAQPIPARYAALVSGLEAHGIKPNMIHLPSTERAGTVHGQLVPGPEYALDTESVTPGYAAPPAPAGVAYYGQNGSDVPGSAGATSIDTSSLAGTLNVTNLTSLYFDTDNPDQWGAQLNAVLVNLSLSGANGSGGAPNDIWAQNTVSYQNLNDTLEVNDNTWNFTSSTAGFPTNGTSTVVANDSSDFNYGGELYVGLGPYFYAPAPFNLTLYLNTSLVNPFICTSESSVYGSATCSDPVNGTLAYVGDETLFYNYSFHDAKTGVTTNGTYDWLTFHTGATSVFDPSNTRVAGFEADGNTANALGLTNDWEFDVGIGAYDGADQDVLNGSGTTGLTYVADCTAPTTNVASTCTMPTTPTYQSVPAALNFGSETGETASGINVGYGSTLATSTTAIFSAGPLNLHPLWGYANQTGIAPGGTPVTNAITVSGSPLPLTASPYIFIFLEDTSVSAPAATYSWAPDTSTWYLMPGAYDWEAMLSDYTEQTGTLTVGSSPTTLSATLPYDPTAGVYTPLWAFGDAQLAGIASTGNGSLMGPYTLFNNTDPTAMGQLDPAFGELNDYNFPTFAGILLWGTTSYVSVHGEVPFLVGSFGTGYNAYLQQELYETQHVTISNATDIYGWPAMESLDGGTAAQNPIPQADVMIWDSSNDLVYGNQFVATASISASFVSPDELMFYGGTNNVVWGNTFSDPQGVSPTTPGTYAGIAEAENGDLIYNNAFQVDNPAPFIVYDPYTELPAPAWNDRWNISEQAATTVALVVNGLSLSGNVLGSGQPFQGGNFWWNYGNSLNPFTTTPYTNIVDYTSYANIFPAGYGPNEAGIAAGGDAVPLANFTLAFQEQGLPSGTGWQVAVLGVPLSSTSSTIVFTDVPNGNYSYIANASGWSASNASGSVVVNGTASTVSITWTIGATYVATISESTLPTGLNWSITVNGVSRSLTTDGGTDTLTWTGLANGSYAYAITDVPGWHQTTLPYRGTLTVVGGSAPIDGTGVGYAAKLAYTPVTFTVTFDEVGLASGTSWYVNITGGVSHNSTGTAISFAEPNGTFDYTLASSSAAYSATPATGSFTVNGTSVSESATFVLMGYAVTFTESGLSTGTMWWVNLTNGQSLSSTSTSLTFHEPNGTYDYSASAAGHSVLTGAVTVDGKAVTAPTINFAGSSSSSLPALDYAIIAVIVIIVLVGIAVVLTRRRGKTPPPPPTPPPQPPEGTAPPATP